MVSKRRLLKTRLGASSACGRPAPARLGRRAAALLRCGAASRPGAHPCSSELPIGLSSTQTRGPGAVVGPLQLPHTHSGLLGAPRLFPLAAVFAVMPWHESHKEAALHRFKGARWARPCVLQKMRHYVVPIWFACQQSVLWGVRRPSRVDVPSYFNRGMAQERDQC